MTDMERKLAEAKEMEKKARALVARQEKRLERRVKEIELMRIGAGERPLSAYLVEMAESELESDHKELEMKKTIMDTLTSLHD